MEVEQQEVVDHQEFNNFKSLTKLIKEWVPICDEGFLPKEGLIFDNLEHENFYKIYAHHVGFSVSKSFCKMNKDRV